MSEASNLIYRLHHKLDWLQWISPTTVWALHFL